MHKLLKVGLTAFGLLALVRLASAAPETASETRSVDTRVVRVQLDGAVDLRIRQGSAGMLVLSGDPRWLARLTVQQSGDTINIGGGGARGLRLVQDPVRAELVCRACARSAPKAWAPPRSAVSRATNWNSRSTAPAP